MNPTFRKVCIFCILLDHCCGVMKSFWYTTKCEKRGEYFEGNKCEKPRTPNSRAMSQENTDGKKSIGICLSVISCIFSSLKVYPSQCSALRMHTCGATMIHIITTCGDDSNQKPEVHPANNLKRPDSQRRDLHKVQLWKSEATVCCVAYSSGKKCLPIYGCPLGQNIQEWKAQRLRETQSKINKYSKNTKKVQQQRKRRSINWWAIF